MYKLKKYWIVCCFIGVVNAASFNSYASDDRQKLIELVEQQNYPAAYQLAEQLFDLLAGDPDFDYLYGLAAYHAGYFQEAIFAFERTLLVRPEDDNARYALALVYFKVENYIAARAEFARLEHTQDEYVRQQSLQYMQAIEGNLQANNAQLAANLSVGLGYDSNVNSGLGDELYPIPIPNVGLVDFKFPEQSAYQQSLSANVLYFRPLTKPGGIIASAAFDKTNYSGSDSLEKANLDLAVGYIHKWQNYTAKATVFYQKFWFGGGVYQDLYAVLGQVNWQYKTNQKIALSSNFSITDNIENDNLDLQTNSFKLSHSYRFSEHKLTTYVSHGKESVTDYSFDSKHYERYVNALGINWQMLVNDWGIFELGYQYQSTRHPHLNETIVGAGGESLFFEQKRKDHINTVKFGFEYFISKQWQWQNSYQISNRNSNHLFYNFDRSVFSSQLNYRF